MRLTVGMRTFWQLCPGSEEIYGYAARGATVDLKERKTLQSEPLTQSLKLLPTEP